MKKILTAIILCATLSLTACSGSSSPTVKTNGNTVTLSDAGVAISFPDSWDVLTGSEMYKDMLKASDNDDIDKLIEEFEADGLYYLTSAYSMTDATYVTVSAQDMTPADGDERVSLSDYARSVHDSTIFDFLASGYKTGDDSSFGEAQYGGKSGYLSHFELFLGDTDDFLFGFSEFYFEHETNVYTIQICYYNQESASIAENIFSDMSVS